MSLTLSPPKCLSTHTRKSHLLPCQVGCKLSFLFAAFCVLNTFFVLFLQHLCLLGHSLMGFWVFFVSLNDFNPIPTTSLNKMCIRSFSLLKFIRIIHSVSAQPSNQKQTIRQLKTVNRWINSRKESSSVCINVVFCFVQQLVFSVDSGAELARSLPTTVPESPSAHQPRTPKTPRTPGRQDPNKTPRFYPVMKESGTIDGQVSSLSERQQRKINILRFTTQVFCVKVWNKVIKHQVLSDAEVK